jgi:hypothetical protein
VGLGFRVFFYINDEKNKVLWRKMEHLYMIVMVLASHYGCCRYGRKQVEMEGMNASQTVNVSETVNASETDVFSVVYDYLVEQRGTFEEASGGGKVEEKCIVSVAQVAPESFFMVALVAAPCVMLLSMMLPSLYACNHSAMKALQCGNTVMVAALMYGAVTMSSKVFGSPWIATSVAMHSSLQISANIVSLVTTQRGVVMPSLVRGAMMGYGALACFLISMCGNTTLASYDDATFSQSHLIAIVILELLTPVIWQCAAFVTLRI